MNDINYWISNIEINKIINNAVSNYKYIENDDIRQTGYLALIKAFNAFNPKHKSQNTFPKFFRKCLYNELNGVYNKEKEHFIIKNKLKSGQLEEYTDLEYID